MKTRKMLDFVKLMITAVFVCACIVAVVYELQRFDEKMRDQNINKMRKHFPAKTQIMSVRQMGCFQYEIQLVASNKEIISVWAPGTFRDKNNYLKVDSAIFLEDAKPGEMFFTYDTDMDKNVVANVHVRQEYKTADGWKINK